MRSLILSLLVTFSIATPAFADTPDAGVVIVEPFTPSEAPATETSTASSAISDPAEHPVQAWDEAKAARKGGWAMLVFFALVALTKALAYGRDKLAGLPVIGALAKRLAVGKTAMIVAGLGAIGAAGYDVLVGGGSLTAALFAAGAAAGGVMHSTTKGA